MTEQPLPRVTPLERVLGIKVSESTYDLLTIEEQLILDLMMTNWTYTDIATLFPNLTNRNVSNYVRRIRYILAEGELHQTLVMRQHYRESHPLVVTTESLREL